MACSLSSFICCVCMKYDFVEFGLSEIDFRYNFDVYTHTAVTFWLHDAMSIDSTNSQSIQLFYINSWGEELDLGVGNRCPSPSV